MAVAMVAVMVMSAMVCILPTTEGSDETIPIKTVDLSQGQTKISTISVNDKAFDFMKDGDGVKIAYKVGNGGYTDFYKYSIEVIDGNPTGSWAASEGTTSENGIINSSLSGTGYDLSIESKTGVPDGEYTFYFTGTEAKTNQSITIKITVISQGAEQYLEYPFKINVYKAFTAKSEILYDSVDCKVGGTFSANAIVKYSSTDSKGLSSEELKNFAFYATGFNTGVGLKKDVSIGGSVPDDLRGGWKDSNSMTLTFVVTDTRTGYMVTIEEVNVSYTLTSGPVVDFGISYTAPGDNVNVEKTTWSEDDAGKTVTIVSTGELKITGATDNKATVVKTESVSTTVETISLDSTEQSISLPGTGTIEIIVSVDGIDEKKITFIVIDDMIPVNSIDVTCGPVVAQDST